jgi:UDP-N-acetylglucosamine acyltransferase
MADNIHPTAIIGENVKIGSNNTICENVIIEGNVTIGNDNYIGPFSHIANNVEIKDFNKFFGQISIGSLGEMGSKGDVFIEDGKVEIGSHNVFREFITVNSPVRKKATKIGNHCYFMARSHIPHDAIIMNNVVMATNSIIGGGCVIHDFAYIGLGSITHQWLTVGESSMLGMNSVNTKNIPPYCIVIGVPSIISGLNHVGASRRGYSEEDVDEAIKEMPLMIKGAKETVNPISQSIADFVTKNENTLTRLKP